MMSVEGEAPPLPECLTGLGFQREAEREALAVVRVIEDQAAEAVWDLALAELDFPAGATAVTAKLVPLLQWSTLSCDQGSDQPLPSGCRHPEPEPIPPIIDNWARGAVPCRPLSLVPGKPPSAPTSSLDEEGQQRQVEGGLRSVTMPAVEDHTKVGDGKGNGTTSGDGPPGAGNPPHRATKYTSGSQSDGRALGRADEEGGVMELLTTLSEGGHHGGEETLLGAGGIGDAIGRRRRQEERMFIEGLRQREEARTRELADNRRRLERADRDAKEKEDRMKKELKGRDWVWGPDGEVLVLDVVPPEKIPGRVVPRIGVRDSAAGCIGGDGHTMGTDAASPSRRGLSVTTRPVQNLVGGEPKVSKGTKEGGSSGSGGAGGGDKGGPETAGRGRRGSRKSGAAARKKNSSRPQRFFEVSATSQPPLVDSLDLQAGVCVKEGSDERQGPAFEEDHKRISRNEVPLGEPLAREPSLVLDLGSVGGAAEAPSMLARGGRSLDPQPGRHGDALSPPATYPLRSASIGSGRRRSGHGSPDGGSLVDQVKTLDPLSGATRLEPVGVGAGGGGGNRGRHRGRRLVVPGGAEPEGFSVGPGNDPEDDPHWRLLKEGGNVGGGGAVAGGFKPVPPPPLPQKWGPRQRRGILTKPELRRPRDRGTRVPIPTIARKHLPPPPVGETMGHGLSPPRDRGVLGASASASGSDAAGFDRGAGGRGVNARVAIPHEGRFGGERGREKEFPALSGLRHQHQDQDFASSRPPADRKGAGPREGRKRQRKGESALRMGRISTRRSQGTLQELFQTT